LVLRLSYCLRVKRKEGEAERRRMMKNKKRKLRRKEKLL
jgi:hypothetical protein